LEYAGLLLKVSQKFEPEGMEWIVWTIRITLVAVLWDVDVAFVDTLPATKGLVHDVPDLSRIGAEFLVEQFDGLHPDASGLGQVVHVLRERPS